MGYDYALICQDLHAEMEQVVKRYEEVLQHEIDWDTTLRKRLVDVHVACMREAMQYLDEVAARHQERMQYAARFTRDANAAAIAGIQQEKAKRQEHDK